MADTNRRIVFLVWSLLILVVMVGVLVAKSVGDKPVNTLKYFTNISWILQILFYGAAFTVNLLLLICETCNCGLDYVRVKDAMTGVIMLYMWPVYGIALLVIMIVVTIIHSNPYLLLHNTKDYGGKYDPGTVFSGNWFFHSLPVILFPITFIVLMPDVVYAFYMTKSIENVFLRVTVIIWSTFLGAILIIGWYSLAVDYTEIYHTHLSVGWGILIAIFVLFVFVGTPYYAIWNSIKLLPEEILKENRPFTYTAHVAKPKMARAFSYSYLKRKGKTPDL